MAAPTYNQQAIADTLEVVVYDPDDARTPQASAYKIHPVVGKVLVKVEGLTHPDAADGVPVEEGQVEYFRMGHGNLGKVSVVAAGAVTLNHGPIASTKS